MVPSKRASRAYRTRSLPSGTTPVRSKPASRAYRTRSLPSEPTPVRSKPASRAYRTRSLPSEPTPVRSKRASRAYRTRSRPSGSIPVRSKRASRALPDAISSLGVHSGPLETRSASRAARAAAFACGPSRSRPAFSIDPPRDPMLVADDRRDAPAHKRIRPATPTTASRAPAWGARGEPAAPLERDQSPGLKMIG